MSGREELLVNFFSVSAIRFLVFATLASEASGHEENVMCEPMDLQRQGRLRKSLLGLKLTFEAAKAADPAGSHECLALKLPNSGGIKIIFCPCVT